MTVYLDSTYVIRHLLGVGKSSELWARWDKAYASTLMRVECFRAADRLRLEGKLDDAGRSRIGAWIEMVCATVTQVPVTDSVLRRASDAFPVAVGTMCAIHLATIQELEKVHGVRCDVASADEEFVAAAKALGFAEASCPAPEAPGESEAGGAAAEEK